MATVSVLMCVFILMKLLAGVQGTFNLTTAIYRKVNMKPNGCQDESSLKTIAQCAVRSLTNYQPFKYLNGECMMCPGDQVTSLEFGGYDFYFPRSQSILSFQTNDEIQLSRPLTPGRVIYVSATPQSDENFFELKSDKPQTTAFHLYIRFNSGAIGMSTLDNGVWGTDEKYSPTDLWALGQRTDMHVLMTLDRSVIYFNRVYFGDYVYRLPLSDVTRVRFWGGGLFYELGL